MDNQTFLSKLRDAIPFLREVPDDIYFSLDTSELLFPTGAVAQVRLQLEQILDQNVMTYQADIFNLSVPIKRHLCAHVKPAHLSAEELATLQTLEQKLRAKGINVSFSAYHRPVVLIKPSESALYDYYQKKGIRT